MNGKKDLYHFLLSLVIILGGGYLMTTQRELQGEIAALLGTVIGWWFTRATNGHPAKG